MNNRLLARIARKGGVRLLDMAIDRLLLEQPRPSAKPSSKPALPPETKAPSITRKVATAALGNVARRSVPAAIIIGGAVLAKTLHDRRESQKARATGKAPASKAPGQGRDGKA